MDSLRPERDELDRFKSRKAAQKPKPPVKEVKRKQEVQAPRSSSSFMKFMVFILICACGALGWGGWQQQLRFDALKTELDDAIGFISQSKLSMARFEGELNEAGQELEQTGSAASKKLAFLDSEMRKLWGVANDRNKKAIEANAGLYEKVDGKLVVQSKRIQAEVARIEKSQNAFEAALERVDQSLKSLSSQVLLAASESAIIREAVDEKLVDVRREISQLEVLRTNVADNKKAIASIDASRRQLNERIVEQGKLLNKLELPKKPTSKVP